MTPPPPADAPRISPGRLYAPLFRNVLFPLYETRLRGRGTLRYLDELERSQWLSAEELRDQQWRAMLDALVYAERHVPFYRRRFAEHGVSAARVQSPDDLAAFPVLTKADLRASGKELVSEVFRGRLYKSATGGSTGQPARFHYDHETYERRMAAALRSDRWAGAELGEREAHVWGIPLHRESPVQKLKRSVHEAVLRKKMLCAFDLSEVRLGEVVDELVRYRPRVVVGYASPLYHLARYAIAHGAELPPVRGVIATAERLFAHQREAIEAAFVAPVQDRYGCREMMLIASECERHQGKHVNVENVFLELYRGERPAAAGEPGEVILSDLVNRSMPLLRYKNEDVAIAATGACSCGRGLPMLASIEGRVLDMIVGPEGQLLAGEFFPHLLKEYPEVARYQVHQARDRSITIRIVPAAGFDPSIARAIEERCRVFLGERAVIAIEVRSEIPVTPGGKFRVAVSEVPVDLGGAVA